MNSYYVILLLKPSHICTPNLQFELFIVYHISIVSTVHTEIKKQLISSNNLKVKQYQEYI